MRLIWRTRKSYSTLSGIGRAHCRSPPPSFFDHLPIKTADFLEKSLRKDCGPAQPPAAGRHASCNPPTGTRGVFALASAVGVLMWQMLKDTFREWTEDKVPRLSAALAFYTMLSLAPLLIISFKIVSFIMRGKGTEQQVENYLAGVSSPQAAETFRQILEKGQQPNSGLVATLVSIVILLFSASGVFGELQTSMNEVWEIAPRPNRGFMATIKDRFFSMTLVLGVAFLLLVSLIITTVIST